MPNITTRLDSRRELVEELEGRKIAQAQASDDAWAARHPDRPMKPDFWDAQSVQLAEFPSGLMKKLGRVTIVPDLRPADRAEAEGHARREAASRAGHCGTAGDDMP